MEKYKHIAQQLQRWQKYGIANGIIFFLKEEMRNRGLSLNDWLYEYKNGFKEHRVTFVVPTPSNIREVLDYPYFEYNGDLWYIDMIHFDDELQVHLMGYFSKKDWTNGGWHTVRESLNLNDTMVLYEYINDRKSSLIILDKDNSDKYNSTGALDVGMFLIKRDQITGLFFFRNKTKRFKKSSASPRWPCVPFADNTFTGCSSLFALC